MEDLRAQRLEVAVTLTQANLPELSIISGNFDKTVQANASMLFEESACNFLISLSELILKDPESREHGDVAAFAYWCRKSNLGKIRAQYTNSEMRKGRGLVFHIAPSNVPINFAFSFAFSLLAGNSNIVRLPSKQFPQENFFFKHFDNATSNSDFMHLRDSNAFVRYSKGSDITQQISQIADARVIWGGDKTVQEISSLSKPLHAIDVCFIDKYSFSIIDSRSILDLVDSNLQNLVERFYNDAYIFDQNACSSPRTIVWIGNYEDTEFAKAKFWSLVQKVVEAKYQIEDSSRMQKYLDLCLLSVDVNYPSLDFEIENSLVSRIQLNKFDLDYTGIRNRYGSFLELRLESLSLLTKLVTRKFQTATYFGVSKDDLKTIVQSGALKGIDRVVPMGSALDIDIHWDGYDLPIALSRIITIK
jgi:hypothetical protein